MDGRGQTNRLTATRRKGEVEEGLEGNTRLAISVVCKNDTSTNEFLHQCTYTRDGFFGMGQGFCEARASSWAHEDFLSLLAARGRITGGQRTENVTPDTQDTPLNLNNTPEEEL